MSILTDRLELIPASSGLLDAAMTSHDALAQALDAGLTASWPPEFYGESSITYTRTKVAESAGNPEWWMYWFVVREPRRLIGFGGYKGPPSADGTVEVGYTVVDDQQRHGYATEATRGLIARAFSLPAVSRVVAETMPDLTPSLRVLEKLGFVFIGQGEEEGAVRYELPRAGFTQRVLTSS